MVVTGAVAAAPNSSPTLIRDAAVGAPTRSIVEKLVTQAHRTDALLNNMLSFACESPLEITSVDLRQLLSAAVGLTRVGQNPRVQLEVRSEGEIPSVAAASSRILQVFLQIIGNGVDAVEETGSGSLVITLRV